MSQEDNMKNISRRDFLKTSLGGAAALSLWRCKPHETKKLPMNVVYIMTDQQPTSTLGCYGNPLNPTPNLDCLAQSGMRFTNFYIGAFPCSPSRASMLTGCYPQRHGVFTNNVSLSDDIPSMGFIMRLAGRETGFFGKSHLKGHMYRDVPRWEPYKGSWFFRRVPNERELQFERIQGGLGEDHPQLGFDTWAGGWKDYHAYLEKVGLGELLNERPKPGNHQDLPSVPEGQHMYSRLPEEHHMAAFFTDNAVDFIRAHQRKDQPFCMVLSYYGPHLPVAPPRPWDEKYSLDQCPLPNNHYDILEGKPIEQKNNKVCYKLPVWKDEQFTDYIRRYYGYCAYIDRLIGRVLDALTECGFDDSTIVIFTSDHGDMVAAHGFIYKIGTCGYQELANVPFIIRVPGITMPGSVTDNLVSAVDILPTLVDTLSLPVQDVMQGISFHQMLSQPQAATRDQVFIHWGEASFVTYDGEWKYVLHWKSETDELYNLKQDPGEMKNLVAYPKYADRAGKKRQEIFGWLRETGHPYAAVIQEEKGS